jgi:hypothetical protein
MGSESLQWNSEQFMDRKQKNWLFKNKLPSDRNLTAKQKNCDAFRALDLQFYSV